MYNSLGQRITLIQKWSGLTASDFSKSIGVLRNQLYRYNDGSQQPNYSVLHSILTRYPQISPQWLMLGVGEMVIQKDTQGLVAEPSEVYELTGPNDAELRTMLKTVKEAISTYIYRAEKK
ncbi:MAG TPA: hypothetical protein VMW01_16520 [Williamwhitmania sp.]|nr:hypothetical protein [Williamwhitmania sp.]